MATKLRLEVSTKFVEQQTDIAKGEQADKNKVQIGRMVFLVAPLDLDKDYWQFRVQLGKKGQAIVGFPKFTTIGIGFAKETDWNTNLPYRCGTDEIFEHIAHNKGDNNIADEDVKRAIAMVQKAAKRWKKYEESVRLRQVFDKEPFLRSGDRLMTLKEFEQHCHVVRASRMTTITRPGMFGSPNENFKVRKCVVLFGLTHYPYSWKYRFDLYASGAKEAMKRAYQGLIDMHCGNGINLKYGRLENVNTEYNGKVPISF